MKRSPHLRSLSHDHHATLAAARGLLQALDADADLDALAADVADLWERDLTTHFGDEERLLLPILQTAEPDTARQMVEEHEQIAALVAQVQDATDDRRTPLAALAEALQAHVRFEERVAFPAVERHAEADALARIGEALR